MSFTEIIPNLWIGDEKSLSNEKFLINNGIKFIVNCTKDIPNNNFNIDTIRINADDRPSVSYVEDNQIMFDAIAGTVETIHKYLMSNRGVLVHCKAGKQRSATIIASYLIKYSEGDINIDKAVYYIRTKRPIAFTPNINFLPALKKYMSIVSSNNG